MNKLYRDTVTLYHADTAAQTVVRTVLRGVCWQQGRRELPDAGGTRRGAALLEKQAALGRKYLEQLRREVVRLAMLADDGLDGRIFAKAAERLEEPELLELRRAYEARAEKRFARPQLRQRAPEERGDETAFLV